MKCTRLFILLMLGLGIGFTLNAQCPQRYNDVVFNKLKITPNILFGGNKKALDGTPTWLALDMYEPADDTATLRPFIVLMHSGGFNRNVPFTRKTLDIQAMAKDLARRGYVVISPEYRLFSGEVTFPKFAQTFGAALFDTHEMMCFLQESVVSGNPYRLDTSLFFMGGVSAGGLIALNFGAFVDEVEEIPEPWRPEFLKMADLDGLDLQTLLDNKFCSIRPKAIFSVSAALLDTNMIKPVEAEFFIMHGVKDTIVPFLSGYPLGDPSFPDVFGSGTLINPLQNKGIPVVADFYPEGNHTPHVFPFAADPLEVIQQVLEFGGIFVDSILDSTITQMAKMAYRIMGSPARPCTVTGIRDEVFSDLLIIYPNPSKGSFEMKVPSGIINEQIRLSVHDISGRLIYEETLTASSIIRLSLENETNGYYFITMEAINQPNLLPYSGKWMKF